MSDTGAENKMSEHVSPLTSLSNGGTEYENQKLQFCKTGIIRSFILSVMFEVLYNKMF